jgi:hypothetical protein
LGASLGIGDGGSYKNNPGFGESVAAWTVAGLLIPGGGEEKAGLEVAEEAANALREAEPIGSALKDDIYHRGATFMKDEVIENGTHFPLRGDDGVWRTKWTMPGNVDGKDGVWEYIVDGNGNLTHQFFKPFLK